MVQVSNSKFFKVLPAKVLLAHHHEVENDHVSFGVLRMAANMVQTAHMLTANCPKMELSGGGIVLDKVIGNPIA